MASVFLSHSSRDKSSCVAWADGLKVYDVKVWLDEVELAVGQPLATRLRDAIETADYLVVVLSLHAVASHWVCEEMQIAYALERELGRSIVRPVLIENLDDRTLDELPCQRPLASFRVRSAHSPSEPEHRARPDSIPLGHDVTGRIHRNGQTK